MTELYPIFYIEYGTMIEAGQKAIVAASSQHKAVSLLEEHVRNSPRLNSEFRGKPIGFEFKEGVIQMDVKSDKEMVLYPVFSLD
ncbi:MAG: hypothetical protein QGF74_02890 [Candidatus Nanoarchaeia archaeon]|jgi:hypothetical protein|nr:hypothetical protein [Candidatus Nanoarchaeia archaeon]|tara:strand:+ start:29051 stop:29302 length:252 start_codon:yes stop_codon:yes gene_type:complete